MHPQIVALGREHTLPIRLKSSLFLWGTGIRKRTVRKTLVHSCGSQGAKRWLTVALWFGGIFCLSTTQQWYTKIAEGDLSVVFQSLNTNQTPWMLVPFYSYIPKKHSTFPTIYILIYTCHKIELYVLHFSKIPTSVQRWGSLLSWQK